MNQDIIDDAKAAVLAITANQKYADEVTEHDASIMVKFAQLRDQRKGEAVPKAWMRKWAFDGEVPKKELNKNGRWAWPWRFKLVELSKKKIQNDDVPLYDHPPQPNALVEALEKAALHVRPTCTELYTELMQVLATHQSNKGN